MVRMRKMNELARFNLFLDSIISNVSKDRVASTKYLGELISFISVCRQVAHYDVRLAKETYFAGLMLMYGMGMWLLDKIKTKS